MTNAFRPITGPSVYVAMVDGSLTMMSLVEEEAAEVEHLSSR